MGHRDQCEKKVSDPGRCQLRVVSHRTVRQKVDGTTVFHQWSPRIEKNTMPPTFIQKDFLWVDLWGCCCSAASHIGLKEFSPKFATLVAAERKTSLSELSLPWTHLTLLAGNDLWLRPSSSKSEHSNTSRSLLRA